jgi:hypothetical protein
LHLWPAGGERERGELPRYTRKQPPGADGTSSPPLNGMSTAVARCLGKRRLFSCDWYSKRGGCWYRAR